MKVVDRNLNGGSPVESGRTQETQRTGAANSRTSSSAQANSGDQVEFSSTLGSLARAMSNFNASRASKVQALAAQYQNGTYRANSQATSKAMVANAITAGAE